MSSKRTIRRTVRRPHVAARSKPLPPGAAAFATDLKEASIRLIEAAGLGDAFLRTVKELDRDALKRLADDELANYGLKRTPTETITIKPLISDLGQLAQPEPAAQEAVA